MKRQVDVNLVKLAAAGVLLGLTLTFLVLQYAAMKPDPKLHPAEGMPWVEARSPAVTYPVVTAAPGVPGRFNVKLNPDADTVVVTRVEAQRLAYALLQKLMVL